MNLLRFAFFCALVLVMCAFADDDAFGDDQYSYSYTAAAGTQKCADYLNGTPMTQLGPFSAFYNGNFANYSVQNSTPALTGLTNAQGQPVVVPDRPNRRPGCGSCPECQKGEGLERDRDCSCPRRQRKDRVALFDRGGKYDRSGSQVQRLVRRGRWRNTEVSQFLHAQSRDAQQTPAECWPVTG